MSSEICSIEGCQNRLLTRGWCNKHYLRFRRHGDPLKTLIASKGEGSITNGYRVHYVDGLLIKEHRTIMERIIGRRLLPEEVVHHKDRDRLNNEESNLMLLPNQAAHQRLHVKEDAERRLAA